MAGVLTVDEMTNNHISVTWDLSIQPLGKGANNLISTPFSLLTDGTLFLFSLLVEYHSENTGTGCRVKLAHNLQIQGRAIITMVVKGSILMTVIADPWRRGYDFYCADLFNRILGSHYGIIKCDIAWLGFVDFCCTPRTTHIPKELCLPRIPYINELMPDVKLVMDDGELSTHKNVLALHSPVFLAMFDTPMKESKENRVVIEDIDFTTMKTLIKILYSAETEDLHDVQVALTVLAAAEKYQMTIIKTACEYKLQLHVTRHNVIELLDVADKYNATQLLRICIEYVVASQQISYLEFQEQWLTRPNVSAVFITTQVKKLWSIPGVFYESIV